MSCKDDKCETCNCNDSPTTWSEVAGFAIACITFIGFVYLITQCMRG